MVPISSCAVAGNLHVIRTTVCRDIVPSGRWDKHVLVYGASDLTKAHPVVSFLAKEKRARSLAIFKPGCALLQLAPTISPDAQPTLARCTQPACGPMCRFDALDTAFPFICSPSTKANSGKRWVIGPIPQRHSFAWEA